MDRPAPMTPPDCDLSDFAFMPLDVARLRDSELASNETPESCWAAVLLWAASWHQIPAASIPNDDKWIAKQAGYALRGKIDKAWADVRPGAMRGWVECSDGRLYHPVVAEKALEAWKSKTEQRYRTEVARVKKHNQRHGTKHTTPDFVTWVSIGRPHGHYLAVPGDNAEEAGDNHGDKPSKGQGEGQRQGQGDYSVTNVTGGDAAKTPEQLTKDELWSAGKSLLVESGMPPKQCGSFVGKLCKDYGDQIVIDAVRTAVVTRPADPAEYLKALCMAAKGQRLPVNKQEALERRNGAIAGEWAAAQQHQGEAYEVQ